MERSYIKDLSEGAVKVSGFIETIRDKKIMFIVLRDISGAVQITIIKDENPEIYEQAKALTPHSFITVEGKCVFSEFVRNGGKEILPTKLTVDSIADVLPIDENSAIDLQMDYRWVAMRGRKDAVMFKAQTVLINALREFLIKEKFVEINTPKIIGAESESGAGVFEVKYFGDKAFLAQSPQFYKQMAMAGGLERVFTQGSVFRAEKSNTYKHATEFTGFDLEFAYPENLDAVMEIEERWLAYALTQIKEKVGAEIKEVFGVEVNIPKLPFPRMKLAEVYEQLEKRYGYIEIEEEKDDLSTEAERKCKQLSLDIFGSEFLFVTDFPAKKRAFYHTRINGVPQGYDLIWKGTEITTGAIREHRLEILKAQAKEKGLGKDIEFYLQFFKFGCPPHGGFGVGIDRMTMLLLEIPTIKQSMFLFRGPNRITP
ncbi:MAG: aspartate--tRNA(Asn) ligase [Christensenellaceae bacterium]|jgi:aspartyl-tRNA synthetase|nr:aspartate--tRNA(Asn) ligase [Christensenellaceae bacterium]